MIQLGNTFDVPLSTVAEHDLHSQTREMNVNASSLQRQSSPCLSSTSSSFSSASSHSLLDDIPHLPFESPQNVNLKKQAVENKDKYSICIEARDGAAMCSTRNLRERERYLDDLQIQIQHEREQEAEERRRREGLKSAPIAGIIPSFGRNNKIVKKGKKRSTSAFWFSSSSSSSSDDEDGRADEDGNLESSSDSSDYEDLRRTRHGRQEEEDHSDFEDFADEKELLYDAPSGSAFACASGMDADLTLSPTRFGMSLMDENVTPVGSPSSSPSSRASSVAARASLAQASGRCISPPPFGYSVGNDKIGRRNSSASNHSTPIKLQYKKSKSLNKARELEMAQAKIKAAAAEADARLALKARQASVPSIDPSKPRELLEIAPEEIVYMECLSTAQTLNQHTLPAMVDAVVEYVVWLRTQARPHLRTSRELQRACAVHYQRQEESFPHQRQPFGFSSDSSTMRNRMAADAEFQPMARKVLIHCSDGYTDSSILALSYIMYDQAISLPQAYLYLQNDCNRSFFVYNSDVAFLQAVEKRLSLIIKSQGRERFNDDISDVEREAVLAAERRAKEREEERAATVPVATAEAERNNQSTSMMAGMGRGVGAATRDMAKNLIPRPGLFSRSSSKDSTASSSTIKAGARVSFNAHSSNTAASTATLPRGPPPPYKASSSQSVTMSVPPHLAARVPKEDANAISHAWFQSEHFDGHFPSRILDYLYLGNLSHASNALMLKELGITHVLSIGESALVPPERQCAPSSGSSAARARTPTNSLWVEHHLGNITVMDVQGINDDGVDTILPHLMAGMRFIDLARQAGGKCLVHCRVGVSRSATIVIGQVMKDLDMSLAEAYLLVRARRLNILIQPTILFMHTLWTWEEGIRNLNPNRAIKDEEEKKINNNPKRPTFEKSGRICWPELCTEIADINNKCKLVLAAQTHDLAADGYLSSHAHQTSIVK